MSTGAQESLEQLLQTTLVQDLPGRTSSDPSALVVPIVVLQANDSISTVLTTLAMNHILGAPVVDGTKVAGLVDLLDIAVFIADQMASSNYNSIYDDLPEDLLSKTKISHVLNFSKLDRLKPVSPTLNLKDLIEVLISTSHRVPVLAEDGQSIATIRSQSDVVRFLWGHRARFGDQPPFTQPLTEYLEKHPTKLAVVRNDSLLVNALQEINCKKVNALAVLDDQQRLVGQISCSQLRHVNQAGLRDSIYLKIDAFLAQSHEPTAQHISSSQTFADAVNELVTKRLHRVWIVDERNHPVGVVSLTDVLRAFVHSS